MNPPGVPDHILFQMEKATNVRGRVVDPDRKPVAGATVIIEVRKRYPRTPQWVDLGGETARSDADGRWSFTGVPEQPDSVKLAAYDYLHLGDWPFNTSFFLEDFRPLSALRDGSATINIPSRGTTIEGRVVAPGGRPVAGAEVILGTSGRVGNSIPPVRTDEEGRFVLGEKPGTAMTLLARAAGFGPVMEPIRIGRETQRVTLRLQPPHPLSGRVVDPQGKPISQAEVRVTSWRGSEGVEQQLTTDADGRFTWNEAPGDEVRISASAIGYATRQGIAIRPGTPQDIVLQPPSTIRGIVADAETGRPIPVFRLGIGTVSRPGEPLLWQRGDRIDTDAKKAPGAFEYTLYERAHRYALRVFADGYLSADSERFLGDGTPRSLAFRLRRAEPVRGDVRNPDETPAVGTTVSLVPPEAEDSIDYLEIRNGQVEDRRRWPDERAKVGPDGRFSLPPQEGNFALVALSDVGYSDRPRPRPARRSQHPAPPLGSRLRHREDRWGAGREPHDPVDGRPGWTSGVRRAPNRSDSSDPDRRHGPLRAASCDGGAAHADPVGHQRRGTPDVAHPDRDARGRERAILWGQGRRGRAPTHRPTCDSPDRAMDGPQGVDRAPVIGRAVSLPRGRSPR